jgi:NAD-dependent dihydropyrimidine dehydrogenase PreA subunit
VRVDGTFIAIEVNEQAADDPQVARQLAEVCPVDIFRAAERTGAEGAGDRRSADGARGALEIVAENVDECVLCRLCLDVAPAGAVKVIKLYDNESLLA